MNRRSFLAAGAGAMVAAHAGRAEDVRRSGHGVALAAQPSRSNGSRFRLKYAPHFGMFRHHAGDDPIDQLEFGADEGFTAWEDNGMKGRPVDLQERIGSTMERLGMTMGVFVANTIGWGDPTLTTGAAEHLDRFVQDCRDSVEVAQRVRARWMTVVPGTIQPRMDMGYQTANVVEALRRGAEIFEPHGLIIVLEPLNFRDHPNLFLTKMDQAYEICRAVDSPSVKILDDLYHQQITEGNLIPNIDAAWSEVAYFQVGDNPGRKEPTTGEINYRNVFRHIHKKGFTGVVGMEHGNAAGGKEGERAVIDAYRYCDDFE